MKQNIILKNMKKTTMISILFLSAVTACGKSDTGSAVVEKFSSVLNRYSHSPADSLKYRAARFLLQNMEGHYTLNSSEMEQYRGKVMQVFRDNPFLSNDQYRQMYSILDRDVLGHSSACDTLYDSHVVTDSFLIATIEDSYRMWQQTARRISFENYCEYILPYRIGCEPLSRWREQYKDRYAGQMEVHYRKQRNNYEPFRLFAALNRGFNGAVYYPPRRQPELPLADLPDVKLASCEEYAARSVAQLRTFGIPSAVDFVPQWGNRSMGHTWTVMFADNDCTLPFGVNESIGAHFNERTDQTMPKVYRRTFSKRKWLEEIAGEKDTYIPELFRDDRLIDVTDRYVETSDTCIEMDEERLPPGAKWCYLAVFNNREWIPVAFAKICDGKARFAKMGTGIVYLPLCFDERGQKQDVGSPFLLETEGRMRVFTADTKRRESVKVSRKYREFESLWNYNRQVEGGRIVASNDRNFSDSVVIATISHVRENRFCTIPLDYKGEYRFYKYRSPNGSYGNIAEIEMYDDAGNEIRPVSSFGGIGAWVEHSPEKVFDGNVLTAYSRISPDGAWAAAELPKPVHLKKIRIHPRTDGNGIYRDNVYQLKYWRGNGWAIIGEKNGGVEDFLQFDGVPENALLLLHNATQGTEERIFTYEDGRQVWW
jgi:hypothetical protein